MKQLILIIVVMMLSGCVAVQQSSNDLRYRMNSVRIGMTHHEVENLIGKPTFVTTTDTASGRIEICDYTFDTENSANLAKSIVAGTANSNEDLSMVVVYNNGLVLSMQRQHDYGSNENVFSSQSDSPTKNKTSSQSPQVETEQSYIADNSTVSNSVQNHANVKPSAGVHVNKDMIVTSVKENSPAYKAGLKSSDVILAFDGIPVTDTATLKQLTDGVKIGDRKSIRVQRGSNILDLTIRY
jgi:outer membrane protein assembly factor BamE (lipoprotein component of BamABCDE complex)